VLTRRRSEAERIHARYGEVLVDVTGGLHRAAEELDVATIDALVKLAERCGRPVNHLPDPHAGADVYFVDDGGVRYRYRATGRQAAAGRRVVL